jgi:hypothetical protein
MDVVSTVTSLQAMRANLGPQLTSLLGNFNITLPALSAQGTITQSAMNALYATAAAAFPAVWTSAIATQINALLTALGYLGTVLMPLVIIGTANASGANGATVSTTVTLPNALPNTSYMVVVDSGQAGTWWVTSKTTAGFNVNLSPPSTSTAIAAGSFSCLVVN